MSILVATGLGGLFVPSVSAAEKPNFVVIFTDDQGYGISVVSAESTSARHASIRWRRKERS